MELLRELGFTESEINTYLALIDLGSTTTGPLIDKSGVSSSKIYEVLERLMNKGFASYVYQGNVRHYQAAPPSRITDYVEEKRQELEAKKQQAEELLPQLQERYTSSSSEEFARVHTGFKGVQNAFMSATEHLSEGQLLQVSGIPKRSDVMTRFFSKWYGRLQEKGVITQSQFEAKAKGQIEQMLKHHDLGEVQFLPSDITSPAAINILDDRILIFPPEENREPVLFELVDERIAQTFRQQFERQWNNPVRVFTGAEGPRIAYEEVIESTGDIHVMGLNHAMADKHIRETRDKLLAHIDESRRADYVLVNGEFTDDPIANHAHARTLPAEYFVPFQIEIYGDTAAIIDWTEPITTVIVNKKEFVQSYKDYFMQLWDIAGKLGEERLPIRQKQQ